MKTKKHDTIKMPCPSTCTAKLVKFSDFRKRLIQKRFRVLREAGRIIRSTQIFLDELAKRETDSRKEDNHG